jgi:GAF domain-containing protein
MNDDDNLQPRSADSDDLVEAPDIMRALEPEVVSGNDSELVRRGQHLEEPRQRTSNRFFVRSAESFLALSSTQQTILRAVLVAAGTYASVLVSQVITSNLSGPGRIVMTAAASLGLISLTLIVVTFVSEAIENVREARDALERQGSNEQAVLNAARYFAEEELKDEVRWTTELDPSNRQVSAPTDPLTLMRRVVESAYQLLETHYGRASRLAETIDFEVTFMTRSYRDEGITIAAWANRDGHRPKSLQSRPGNPTQYETTVTKAVYDDPRHSEVIVEDTYDEEWKDHYNQYEGQRERIRSAIVWPVLSANYELLGTLVMHCDRPRFFLREDRKFWKEMCSVYARRLALARLRLDQSFLEGDNANYYGPGAGNWLDPPF